jgi:hypothetical protein
MEEKIQWYCVPHTGEIGSYKVCGSLTDFPRGVYLAYGDCCLVTGFNSKKEAEEGIKEYPCEKFKTKEEVGNSSKD